MGIAVMEGIITTVRSILKTLECPICFELLKVPVSAGCGHFFCRHCVTGILQSNYRAPCPLCKRSFTRRSVQTASQRQTIISAAKNLAQTCSSLTGTNFNVLDSFVKENRKSTDIGTPVPQKKFRSSSEKVENVSLRKRKSIENEGVENGEEHCTDVDMEKNLEPHDESSNKRVRPNSDEKDSDDELPSLDEILSQRNEVPKRSTISHNKKDIIEKPLSIFPTDKMSKIKTYSSIRMRKDKLQQSSIESKFVEKKDNFDNCVISSNRNISCVDEKESSLSEVSDTVHSKNKTNALKNKTNEVHSKPQNNLGSKTTNVKISNENQVSEIAVKSKENKMLSNSSLPSLSPNLKKEKKKLSRPKRVSTLKNEELENGVANKKDCYTLNEVDLPSLQNKQLVTKNGKEDTLKSLGLTDSAVSVNDVSSPLQAKSLSTAKSPGWSRVKEVKKDFKVKKFASLNVEKNSPNVASLKHTLASDPNEDKSESLDMESKIHHKTDYIRNAINNSNSSLSENRSNEKSKESTNGLNFSISKTSADEEEVCQNGSMSLTCGDLDVTNECKTNTMNDINSNPLRTSVEGADPNIACMKPPSVSITSNSIICANYVNTKDKVSKQNVLKTKIICELPNNVPFNNDLPSQNRTLISKYIQDNCPSTNVPLNDPSGLKHIALPLQSQISGYQSFQAHSIVNENDGFQLVEQSQQTSQLFNLDFQNAEFRNLNPNEPYIKPNKVTQEKTKVVKRTCLTLEEIQDGFIRSNESNHSETLCSVPFLDNLFKLHIAVSDDTLNVSVLKVIEDVNSMQTLPLNKYIQTSNNFTLPKFLPSSNAGSESSQPDPFPNLNKAPVLSDPVEEYSALQKDHGHYEDQFDCQKGDNGLDMSEIIHFPPQPVNVNDELVQKSKQSSSKEANSNDISTTTLKAVAEEQSAQIANTLERHTSNRNCANVLTSLHSNNKAECFANANTSPLKDLSVDLPPLTEKTSESHLEKKDIIENQVMELDSDEFSNSDKEEIFLEKSKKAFFTKKCPSLEKALSAKQMNEFPLEENEVMQLGSDFSNSDEESLKKLEKCVNQGTKDRGKRSRLSLKKRTKAVQLLSSSEESDIEYDPKNESMEKTNNKVASMTEKYEETPLFEEDKHSLQESKIANFKSTLSSTITGETSTLNSEFSEDAHDTNASEIVLEIEDLADKIKSLEGKLKQCGYGLSNTSLLEHSKREISGDSEDSSSDLFPQSVPPTPPNT